jgi:hypothetical protein
MIDFREEEDPKTIGQLFYVCCDEIEDIRFAQAMIIILELLGSTMAEVFLLTDEQIKNNHIQKHLSVERITQKVELKGVLFKIGAVYLALE